jgi:hypothetical protein
VVKTRKRLTIENSFVYRNFLTIPKKYENQKTVLLSTPLNTWLPEVQKHKSHLLNPTNGIKFIKNLKM